MFFAEPVISTTFTTAVGAAAIRYHLLPEPAEGSMSGKLALLEASELHELVAAAVREALAEREPRAAPALLDRRGIAAALGIGVDTVDRLRREGCPELTVGDAPRFELAAVLAWLRERRNP
jgi:hypothetical protein